MESGYKSITVGELNSVDLDFNNTNILNISEVDQFIKTCSSGQQFILINETITVFKLVLTGGSLNSNLFIHSDKKINITEENGSLSDYDAAKINRIYVFVEKIFPTINLTISINVEE